MWRHWILLPLQSRVKFNGLLPCFLSVQPPVSHITCIQSRVYIQSLHSLSAHTHLMSIPKSCQLQGYIRVPHTYYPTQVSRIKLKLLEPFTTTAKRRIDRVRFHSYLVSATDVINARVPASRPSRIPVTCRKSTTAIKDKILPLTGCTSFQFDGTKSLK